MNIEEAVKASGSLSIFNKGSIKAAESLIMQGEELFYAMIANVSIAPAHENLKVDVSKLNNKMSGVLAVTSKRIFFCNSVLGKGTSKQIMLKDITSIDDSISLLQTAKLRICGISEMFIIDGNSKNINQIQIIINEARM